MMKIQTFVFLALAAAACGPLLGAPQSEKSFYVLTDNGSTPEVEAVFSGLQLLVRDAQANGFINSRKIVFSESDSTRGYYQFASWVESPSEKFTSLLVERFTRAKAFGSVSRVGNSTIGDFQLNTEIVEFYHDVRDMPGTAVVRINAELVDLRRHTALRSTSFEQKIPVTHYSADGAVRSFSTAVNNILDSIVRWTASSGA